MSQPSPPPSPPRPRHGLPLSPTLLMRLGIAFGIGLVLFLLLWLDARHDYDFYKADGSEAAAGQSEPLPAPLPPDVAAAGDGASGLHVRGHRSADNSPAAVATGEQPRITEAPRPAPAAAAPAAGTGNDRAAPEPLSTPAPRYPQEALRMGVGGTVRINVTVAADGSVDRLVLAEGSGNRYLDRAALDTVRRWRFQPATRNGQPVVADVLVPIVFNPDGR